MSEKKEYVIGMMIGDGCISKTNRFVLSHSITQSEYFFYKKNILEEFNIHGKYYEKSPSGFGKNKTLSFYSNTTPLLKQLRKDFYPNGTKIIPDDLIITPLMWSFIYQDDGRQNRSTHYYTYLDNHKIRHDYKWVNRYTIYTDCFSIHSINNLQKSLESYNIKSSINFSNKNKYPHIHIYDKQSKTNFKNMIEPYIHESMKYKLNLPTYIH